MNRDLQEYINEFLADSDLPPNTYKAYKSDLNTIIKSIDSLDKLNNESKLRQLRLEWLDRYATKTIFRKWSSLREFLRYCHIRGYVKDNKISKVDITHSSDERKRKTSVRSKNLTEKQIKQIVSICDAPDKLRDKAILWFLLSTGVRISELLQYGYLSNLNLPSRQFEIPGRVMFLSDTCVYYLSEYFKEREVEGNLGIDDAIFCQDNGEMLKEAFLYSLFKDSSQKILNGRYPYQIKDLRRVLAAQLYSVGVGSSDIIYLLGIRAKKSLSSFIPL